MGCSDFPDGFRQAIHRLNAQSRILGMPVRSRSALGFNYSQVSSLSEKDLFGEADPKDLNSSVQLEGLEYMQQNARAPTGSDYRVMVWNRW